MASPKRRMDRYKKMLKRIHKWSRKTFPEMWAKYDAEQGILPQPSKEMKYRYIVDAPDYLVGYGKSDIEFTVTARTLSKVRAEQLVRLLNQDEKENGPEINRALVEERNHINPHLAPLTCQCCHGAYCSIHNED